MDFGLFRVALEYQLPSVFLEEKTHSGTDNILNIESSGIISQRGRCLMLIIASCLLETYRLRNYQVPDSR